MSGNTHVLPDSRLRDKNWGTVFVDWDLPSGRKVKVECTPIFCANCGKEFGLVPKENTTFDFHLCQKCFETHGGLVGCFAQPDADFCSAVAHELESRFGAQLDTIEIARAVESDVLGPSLKALLRDSPYASEDHRPKGV